MILTDGYDKRFKLCLTTQWQRILSGITAAEQNINHAWGPILEKRPFYCAAEIRKFRHYPLPYLKTEKNISELLYSV